MTDPGEHPNTSQHEAGFVAYDAVELADQILAKLGSTYSSQKNDLHLASWDIPSGERIELQRQQDPLKDGNFERLYFLRVYPQFSATAHDFYRFYNRHHLTAERCDEDWQRLSRRQEDMSPQDAIRQHLTSAGIMINPNLTRQGYDRRFSELACLYALTSPRMRPFVDRLQASPPTQESFTAKRKLISNVMVITGLVLDSEDRARLLDIARGLDTSE